MLRRREPDTQAIAIVVEAIASAVSYLEPLERSAGLRWVLLHNIEVYRTMLARMGDAVRLVVIDFSSALTEKLQFYMELVRQDAAGRVPVLLLASESTESRARRVAERDIDRVLVRPLEPSVLETTMGEMMGRSTRREIEVKFWLFLEERVIEGKTTDLSDSGMGGWIPDPILFSRIHVRLFAPGERNTVDLLGNVRRKLRDPQGGYRLGVEWVRYLEGDPAALKAHTGIQFTHLATAGEATITELRSSKKKGPA